MRRKALLVFLGGVTATAGFWFLRNLIHSGNPLPWVQELGPIDLPGPDRGLEGRDNYTVAHYIFETPDTDVWSEFFCKAITNLLGPLWFADARRRRRPGRCSRSSRPRTPIVRLLGAVTVVGGDRLPVHPADRGRARGRAARLRHQPALPRSGPGARASRCCPLEPKLTPERVRLPLLVGGAAGPPDHLAVLGLRLHLGRAVRLDPRRGPDRHRLDRRPRSASRCSAAAAPRSPPRPARPRR